MRKVKVWMEVAMVEVTVTVARAKGGVVKEVMVLLVL